MRRGVSSQGHRLFARRLSRVLPLLLLLLLRVPLRLLLLPQPPIVKEKRRWGFQAWLATSPFLTRMFLRLPSIPRVTWLPELGINVLLKVLLITQLDLLNGLRG